MATLPRVEIVKGRNNSVRKHWHWRLRAANGEILCWGENHTRPEDARGSYSTVTYLLEVGQPPIYRTTDDGTLVPYPAP